jgi:uncharacterized RDD family membrane protein YckC
VTERVRQVKARRSTGVDANEIPAKVKTRTEGSELNPALDHSRQEGRDTGPIVEAALSRVRRAKQERADLALPAMTGSAVSASGAKTSIIVDREATARALDPAEDARAMELNRLAPQTARSAGNIVTGQSTASAAKAVPRRSTPVVGRYTDNAVQADTAAKTVEQTTPLLETVVGDPLDDGPIEEIDPVDYLEAEVRKVDQSLARELMSDDGAPVISQIITGITDLLTIAISSVPFFALIQMASGSLSDRTTLVGVVIVVGVLAVFYLSLTQSLCGKTFGMMFTNTRVIDVGTGKHPSFGRALARSLSYPVAVAPAGIGILWAAVDPGNRAWQDIISGTRVVRDF